MRTSSSPPPSYKFSHQLYNCWENRLCQTYCFSLDRHDDRLANLSDTIAQVFEITYPSGVLSIQFGDLLDICAS